MTSSDVTDVNAPAPPPIERIRTDSIVGPGWVRGVPYAEIKLPRGRYSQNLIDVITGPGYPHGKPFDPNHHYLDLDAAVSHGRAMGANPEHDGAYLIFVRVWQDETDTA